MYFLVFSTISGSTWTTLSHHEDGGSILLRNIVKTSISRPRSPKANYLTTWIIFKYFTSFTHYSFCQQANVLEKNVLWDTSSGSVIREYYMEQAVLLPCSQDPATGSCSEAGLSSPYICTLFLRCTLIILCHAPFALAGFLTKIQDRYL